MGAVCHVLQTSCTIRKAHRQRGTNQAAAGVGPSLSSQATGEDHKPAYLMSLGSDPPCADWSMVPADADFLAFKEQLEKGPEPLPSAEAQLEKQEAEARERQAAGEHGGAREELCKLIATGHKRHTLS